MRIKRLILILVCVLMLTAAACGALNNNDGTMWDVSTSSETDSVNTGNTTTGQSAQETVTDKPSVSAEEPATDDEDATQVQEETEPENLRAGEQSYLEYTILIPGGGSGDHPAFQTAVKAKEALALMGITLNIDDPQDASEMTQRLMSDDEPVDMWAAAWSLGSDSDLYSRYCSANIPGAGGTNTNYFRISDSILDSKITEASAATSYSRRRVVYADCLDLIMSKAVEIPNYQRRSAVIFSPASVNTKTVSPALTSFWSWEREIEKIEMNDDDAPLRVATGTLSGQYSPFFAITDNDKFVSSITSQGTLTTDREGNVVFNAIEGETRSYGGDNYTYTGPADINVEYNSETCRTVYTVKLREDIAFSNGGFATADDLIFALYVMADPDYSGPMSIAGYGVVGLDEYRRQSSGEQYQEYADMFDRLYAEGEQAEHTGSDATAAQTLWDCRRTVWLDSAGDIIYYVGENYMSLAEDERYSGGFTTARIKSSTGLRTAFAMAVWGYGAWDENGTLVCPSGRSFDCANGKYPTQQDFYAELYQAYSGDIEAYAATEDVYGYDLKEKCRELFIRTMLSGENGGSGVVSGIEGIVRVDDYTVQIITDGYNPSAIYTLCDIPIVPMEYYSAISDEYDYDNGCYGVVFGDIDATLNPTALSQPMGAGPYVYSSQEDGTLILSANEKYYKGTPKTKEIYVLETSSSETIRAVAEGTADCGKVSGSSYSFAEICSYNSNGEMSGDKINTAYCDGSVYGYIGINESSVCVNGEADSDESIALRRAFCTLFSFYRYESNEAYYGESAVTVEYPVAGTSVSMSTDDAGYTKAYCVDANGEAIYTEDMSYEEKEAAVIEAVRGYLALAGFEMEAGVVVGPPQAKTDN